MVDFYHQPGGGNRAAPEKGKRSVHAELQIPGAYAVFFNRKNPCHVSFPVR